MVAGRLGQPHLVVEARLCHDRRRIAALLRYTPQRSCGKVAGGVCRVVVKCCQVWRGGVRGCCFMAFLGGAQRGIWELGADGD